MTPTTAPRRLPHPAPDQIRLEGVLHALSDPARVRIVCALAAAESGLTCSAVEVPVSKSTLTHHYRVLREAGVVAQVYRGTSKVNSLRRDELEELFPGLLEALLTAADRQDRRS
ncbi:ArsR/SmtB family transcription factor [Streptomyces xiaopingdaonensis]|uniref:ArsR/SmtB family transcription factor n=1 Tax=Streptomyces xiaopingdaonensis TaxID=1565415 RepID=UPI0002F37B25|nr:helix-turn-helix domain-containing protein [Streptomyces xiaopingdaonensis]